MASLDDIYDIVQKLDETNSEYLFISIQKGKKRGKADVFFALNDDQSFMVLAEGLGSFQKEIDRIRNEKENEDDKESE
jgi:hypothetical protein